jgi:hypothetical protein
MDEIDAAKIHGRRAGELYEQVERLKAEIERKDRVLSDALVALRAFAVVSHGTVDEETVLQTVDLVKMAIEKNTKIEVN